MDLVLVGINHESTPLEVREKFDFCKVSSDAMWVEFSKTPSIHSGMVLSTCNRVEVYVAAFFKFTDYKMFKKINIPKVNSLIRNNVLV